MLRHMSHWFIACTCISVSTLLMVSCSDDPDVPILAGNTQAASSNTAIPALIENFIYVIMTQSLEMLTRHSFCLRECGLV